MKLLRPLLLAVLAATALSSHAKYNGEDRGKPVMPAEVNAKWKAECSSCHMAYPSGLLPAASWKKVMAGLDKHFGVDASLTPAEVQEITAYLTKYPSNRWTATTAPLRITESEWFKAKHFNKGEIAPEVWKREAVKGPAYCNACHLGAEKGDFNENSIRIPR